MAEAFFPLNFQTHIVFVIIGALFYLLQFYRTRHVYQALMAVAIAATLLIYISDTLFIITGFLELFLIIAVFILLAKLRSAEAKAEKAERKLQEDAINNLK